MRSSCFLADRDTAVKYHLVGSRLWFHTATHLGYSYGRILDRASIRCSAKQDSGKRPREMGREHREFAHQFFVERLGWCSSCRDQLHDSGQESGRVWKLLGVCRHW